MEFRSFCFLLMCLFLTGCSNDSNPDAIQPDPDDPQQPGIPEKLFSVANEGAGLAVRADGTLWAWGMNNWGQFGNGLSNSGILPPQQVGADADWKSVEYAQGLVVALKTNGSIWYWGSHGNEIQISSDDYYPTQLGTTTGWKNVAKGSSGLIAIATDGSLWSWEEFFAINDPVSSLVPVLISDEPWIQVSGTENYWMAIKADGTLWARGINSAGNLGNGTLNHSEDALQQVGTDTDWKQVSISKYSCLAIKENGSLYAWGANYYGTLGLGHDTQVWVPTQVGADYDWQTVSVFNGTTCLLKTDGTIWSCGLLLSELLLGHFVDNTAEGYVPVQIGQDNDWAAFTAGADSAFARKINGDTYGMGISYRLGLSTTESLVTELTPIVWP